MSTVLAWNSAVLLSENADIGLRIEFTDEPESHNVSALQFGLTAAQARALSADLAAHADKLETQHFGISTSMRQGQCAG
ncbi:hypothetical protein [Ensifer sp. ENS11]|uniref:hypothetical protein n=1 Tax=Ensifer sp. ENS11 TaxID=2769291 RepID=UPI001782741E|nr:hypothetical protein [Ensifer sp. ENS11]MBD9490004.1 hypothetical protein [Ensifer sp. ENS11]